jgi:hypothetical protein
MMLQATQLFSAKRLQNGHGADGRYPDRAAAKQRPKNAVPRTSLPPDNQTSTYEIVRRGVIESDTVLRVILHVG